MDKFTIVVDAVNEKRGVIKWYCVMQNDRELCRCKTYEDASAILATILKHGLESPPRTW